MKPRRPLLLLMLVIMAGILSMPRLFLVPKATSSLEKQLAASFRSSQVQVDLGVPWGWELLFGYVPSFKMEIENGIIDGLEVSKVEIQGENVSFDPLAIWRGQEFIYREADKLWGEISVTEEALNSLFWREIDLGQNLALQVSPEGIAIDGIVSMWGLEMAFTLSGVLEVWQGSTLRFVPKDFEVQDTRIPSFLLEVLNQNYDFVLNFDVFPYPTEITDVRLLEDQIKIRVGGVQ